jgi:hypothetical protein
MSPLSSGSMRIVPIPATMSPAYATPLRRSQ